MPVLLERLAATAAAPAIAALSFPCARHGCGCRTAEQCRTRCCCRPRRAEHAACARHTDESQPAARVTYLTLAECAGRPVHAAGLHVARLAPHLPIVVCALPAVPTMARGAAASAVLPGSVRREPLEKVPIQPA